MFVFIKVKTNGKPLKSCSNFINVVKLKNRKKNRNRPEILPRYMTQGSVDDETSSTSTESSLGEIEEKVAIYCLALSLTAK